MGQQNPGQTFRSSAVSQSAASEWMPFRGAFVWYPPDVQPARGQLAFFWAITMLGGNSPLSDPEPPMGKLRGHIYSSE